MDSSTTRPTAGVTPSIGEFVTPLNAVSVWVALVGVGWLWPTLGPVTARLAFAGQVVVLSLMLHALHEAGHLLAGALVGLPFRAVTVGLITVRREHEAGVWRFVWDVNRSWRKFAGCVERVVTPAPGVRVAMTVTALGGPVASLLVGLALLAAPSPWSGLGSVSLLVAAFNAVPSAVFGQLSDGMIVFRLWSQQASALAWRATWCDATPPADEERV